MIIFKSSSIRFKWKHARNLRKPPERIIQKKEGMNERRKREREKGEREGERREERKKEKRKKTAAQIVKLSLSPGLALAHNQLNKEVISV